jgi:hypothetical protein
MLRITTRNVGHTVIEVDGQLAGEGVAELERVIRDAERPFLLNLGGLVSADDAGVELLRTLAKEGTALRDASPYIKLLLEDDS